VTEDQAKHFKRIRSKIERVKTADPGIIFETQDVKKCVKAKMIVDDLKKLKHFSNSSSSRWLVWQTPVLLDEYFKYKKNIKRKTNLIKRNLPKNGNHPFLNPVVFIKVFIGMTKIS